MSRKRRRRKVGKHISLSATDADWETVRSNAKRRGLSIARYLVELVERDASEEDAGLRHECPELALAKEEQRELLEAVREVRALMLEGEDAGPLVRDMQERIGLCCKPDVGVSQIRTTTVLSSCFCVGQTVL